MYRKISEALRKLWQDPKYRQRQSLARSKSACKLWEDPTFRDKIIKALPRGENHPNYKHGHRLSLTYVSFQSMIKRCENPNNKDHSRYGGQGIRVCKRWRHNFLNFLEDMGERPIGKVLHRVDSKEDYKPKNCIWMDRQKHNVFHSPFKKSEAMPNK